MSFSHEVRIIKITEIKLTDLLNQALQLHIIMFNFTKIDNLFWLQI